ncbi:hypothetical protein GW17_00013740 [Ensete ventricosum]|nr:hypothetical protein GW17_00013740 [Ensete ventricosum]
MGRAQRQEPDSGPHTNPRSCSLRKIAVGRAGSLTSPVQILDRCNSQRYHSPLVNEHPDPERERERVNPTIPLRPSFDSSLLRRLHPKCPKFGFLRVASDLCEKVKERKEVVWKVTMASGDVGGGGAEILMMDEAYEFSAPRFFDFINGETEEDIKRAELWFETSLSYAPSRTFLRSGFVIFASVVVFSFVPRIREGRSTQIDSLCDFGNVEKEQKVSEVERCQNNIVPQQETSCLLLFQVVPRQQKIFRSWIPVTVIFVYPRCSSNIAAKNSMGIDIAQENQAVKRQKLHDGRFRQVILVSDTASVVHRRSKLTLTRPKDPELETAHRVRAVRIKSSAELEEEMLAKIPKFKARPLNKKLSLHSESSNHEKKEVPRITIPNPFHLHTEVCEHCLLKLAFQFLIKEKELRYKRLREEQESAKMNIYRSMKQRTKPKSPDLRVNHRVERRHALHMR